MKAGYWIRFLIFPLIITFLGCAPKEPGKKIFSIAPVTPEESRLIELRLKHGQPIHPYEQILPSSSRAFESDSNSDFPEDPITSVFDFLTTGSAHPGDSTVALLISFLQEIRGSTLAYFKAYSGDQASLQRIQSRIPNSQCFDDGSNRYCGPAVLDSLFFLLSPTTWSALNLWIHAVDHSMVVLGHNSLDSAILGDLFRYWGYGLYQPFESEFQSSLNKKNCQAAMIQLESQGETPRTWEINPCRLTLVHQPRGSGSTSQFLKEFKK